MEQVRYGPPSAPLNGEIQLPSSKSMAHRAILAAALSGATCSVAGVDDNADIRATLGAIAGLGIAYTYDPAEKMVELGRFPEERPGPQAGIPVDCGESGSTLRFAIPIFAALGKSAVFVGHGKLPERPIGIYRALLTTHGVTVKTAGGLPFQMEGQLRGGVFMLPGNVSSQFVTGLLFALPLLAEDSEILLTTPLESAAYVNLTLQVLRDFGITVTETPKGWRVPGQQRFHAAVLRSGAYRVEGDWSHAAFFLSLAGASPGSCLRLKGLRPDSLQGDRACVALYRNFGLRIQWSGSKEEAVLTVWGPKPGEVPQAQEIDGAQIPDLVPALAVMAVFAKGTSKIRHVARLRIKECDRLAAMTAAITALGGSAWSTEDTLFVEGKQLSGGTAEGMNDHRVVMSLAAAGVSGENPVYVTDPYSIRKSYPHFFRDYQTVGGNVHVVNMG